jgi:hypothetical protein
VVARRDNRYNSKEIPKDEVDIRRLSLKVNNQFDVLALGEGE